MWIEEDKCTGCGACLNICSENCIVMKGNAEGFLYPVINSEQCVECKLCEQVCPVLNKTEQSKQSEAYAALNQDAGLRRLSSSGGVFSGLAKVVIRQGGYVCGAIYDDNFKIVHKLSNNEKSIAKMRGAKYAQSDAWRCFKEIKEKLGNHEEVLFVGTPCQVAGLKQYLHKDYNNLVTVDMICHGTPSPMIWNHYVKERKKIDAPNSELTNIELRNKDSGWSRYKYSVKFSYKNNAVYCVEQWNDMYMRGFVNNLFLRPSCANCHFKGIERCSDITLGDYWGIWDQNPEFDDNQGTSLVFVHTVKGKQLWNCIAEQFQRIQVNPDDAVAQNPSALVSSVPHEKRTVFFEDYDEEESLIKQIEQALGTSSDKNASVWRKAVNKLLGWRR